MYNSLGLNSSDLNPVLRRLTRTHIQPAYLQDYVCNNILLGKFHSFAYCTHTLTNNTLSSKYVCFSILTTQNRQLLTTISNMHKPSTYEEVISVPAWQEAMQKELDSLVANEA